MPELDMSGSVGAPGEQSPVATRQLLAPRASAYKNLQIDAVAAV